MNKESIYRIIGYQGEYTNSVKKALKKLLKENHPDHHGNNEVFKLIQEVKKELENNQVSFKYNKSDVVYDDIDYEYCMEMIEKIEKNKQNLERDLNDKKDIIKDLSNKYKILYDKSIKEKSLLLNDNYLKSLSTIKSNSIFIIIILIIIFLIAVIKNSLIFFIIFGIICIVAIIIIGKFFETLNKLSKKSELKIKKYVDDVDKIKSLIEQRSKITLEIFELERNIKNMENDLRFYNNLLKYR